MDITPPTIYDDTYTGRRFRYGYIFRPCGIGCQPKGFIVGSYVPALRIEDLVRHGSIEYPRQLTEDEVRSFELVPLQADGTEFPSTPRFEVRSRELGTLYAGDSGSEARKVFDQCIESCIEADVYIKGVFDCSTATEMVA